MAGSALPAALGGGCELLVAPEAMLPIVATGTTATVLFPVPVDPALRGTVLYTQWAQFDPNSPATLPVSFSDGGIVVVH